MACLVSFLSLCGPSWRPILSRWILLTRAAIPASCVPMKFVASTLAYSHDRCGKEKLKLICSVSSSSMPPLFMWL